MLSEPQIITREAEPYVAVRASLPQPRIAAEAPRLIGAIATWMAEHGVANEGPLFFNYTRMGETMDLEVGFPIAAPVAAEGDFVSGLLPAGRYASVRYTGPYDGLYEAHGALHRWLDGQGLAPLNLGAPQGRSTLLEIYVSDPDEEPAPITDIVFRLPD